MKFNAQILAQDITHTLNATPKARRINDAANEATEALRRSDLHLLLIDEADNLDVLSFELLRRLHDRTGCPIVLVGLPGIYRVIGQYEKYESRIGMFVSFDPLTEEEVLTTVLPQMVIPRWTYDPTNTEDHAMGMLLWDKVKPSFRKLRAVLTNASQFAQRMQQDRILPDTIQLALDISLKPKRPNNRREETRTSGSYEEVSEERQRSRRPRTKEEVAFESDTD